MYIYIKYEIITSEFNRRETNTTKFKLTPTNTVKDIKNMLEDNFINHNFIKMIFLIVHRFKILNDDIILFNYLNEWDTLYILVNL
jgi:hypothetical protein